MTMIRGIFATLVLLCAAMGLHAATEEEQIADDVAAIGASRAASNAGIAAHDVLGATAALLPNARVFASGGTLLDGAEAMRAAFARSFEDPSFVTYTRAPTHIEIGWSGVAAEHGKWVGLWRMSAGEKIVTGTYLATWKRIDGRWQVFAEQYIPLACVGVCAAAQ